MTLTGNPSVDLLFETEGIVWDDANRVRAPRRRAGGQGINVARAVRALGGRAVAVAPLGGAAGRELSAMLDAEGAELRAVPIRGETRVFVAVRDRRTGRSLLLNPPGPALSDRELARLRETVLSCIDPAAPGWLAACGSLPPGIPPTFYADLAVEARARGWRFVPDCDGPALRGAAEAGCDLLVPNEHETARLLGRAIGGPEDAALAAHALLDFGPSLAVVTLGPRGAVCATAEGGAWHVSGPARGDGFAVGAGDALLAGLLVALMGGADAPDALARGVAAGTAVLLTQGDSLVKASDVDAVRSEITLRSVG